MAKGIFTLAFVFAVSWKLSGAIGLNCTFETRSFPIVGSIYICTGTISYVPGNSEDVTAVYGVHQTGMGHGNVHGVYTLRQNLRFVPTNIESFFPNLKLFDFGHNYISNIKNSHLIPFRNLTAMSLHDNLLTSLHSNLFSGLESMQRIILSNNYIKHIGHDFILPDTGSIHFENNTCIDVIADTPIDITALRFSLLVNCPPTISQIEDNLESRPNLLTNVNSRVQILGNRTDFIEQSHFAIYEEVKCTTSKVTDLESRNLQLTNEVADLQESNSQLTDEVEGLQRSIVELTDRNTHLETRIGFVDTRAAYLEVRVAVLESIIESKLGLKKEEAIIMNENEINEI